MAHEEVIIHSFGDDFGYGGGIEFNESIVLWFPSLVEVQRGCFIKSDERPSPFYCAKRAAGLRFRIERNTLLVGPHRTHVEVAQCKVHRDLLSIQTHCQRIGKEKKLVEKTRTVCRLAFSNFQFTVSSSFEIVGSFPMSNSIGSPPESDSSSEESSSVENPCK